MQRAPEEKSAHKDLPDPDVAGIGNTVAPKPVVPTPVEPVKPPRPSATHDPGPNRLLHGAFPSSIGIYTPFSNRNSTVVPNFRQMDRTITDVETALLSNQNYVSEKGNRLSAEMVKYYYFTTSMYVIFRNMVHARQADISQIEYVRNFESRFDVKNMPIDGMMRPFFLSLATSDTKYEEVYHRVLYVIKANLDDDYDWNELVFKTDYLLMIPNIPLLLRAIRRQCNGRTGDNNDARQYDNPTWNLTTDNSGSGQNNAQPLIRVDPGTGPRTTRMLYLTPGFTRQNPSVPKPREFGKCSRNEWPPCPIQKPHYTWDDFFGFSDAPNQEFFVELLQNVEQRNGFINSSVTLDDVMTSNTGSVKLEIRLEMFDDPTHSRIITQPTIVVDAPSQPSTSQSASAPAQREPSTTQRMQDFDATAKMMEFMTKMQENMLNQMRLMQPRERVTPNAPSRGSSIADEVIDDIQMDPRELVFSPRAHETPEEYHKRMTLRNKKRLHSDSSQPLPSKKGKGTGKVSRQRVEALPTEEDFNDVQRDQIDGMYDLVDVPDDYCSDNYLTRIEPILRGKKRIMYKVIACARETDVPESVFRLALLTQFSAPPLTMLTQNRQVITNEGPFWNENVKFQSLAFDPNDMLGPMITSDFIRMTNAKTKY